MRGGIVWTVWHGESSSAVTWVPASAHLSCSQFSTQISSGLSRLGPLAQDPPTPPGASLYCDGNLGRELLSHIHNKFYDVYRKWLGDSSSPAPCPHLPLTFPTTCWLPGSSRSIAGLSEWWLRAGDCEEALVPTSCLAFKTREVRLPVPHLQNQPLLQPGWCDPEHSLSSSCVSSSFQERSIQSPTYQKEPHHLFWLSASNPLLWLCAGSAPHVVILLLPRTVLNEIGISWEAHSEYLELSNAFLKAEIRCWLGRQCRCSVGVLRCQQVSEKYSSLDPSPKASDSATLGWAREPACLVSAADAASLRATLWTPGVDV